MYNIVDYVIICIIALVLAVLTWLGYVMFNQAQSPGFELKKNEWNCSKTSIQTTLIPQAIGKTTILIPYTREQCDEYTRNK